MVYCSFTSFSAIGMWQDILWYCGGWLYMLIICSVQKYGDELIGFLDKPKRVLVFLNPQANNGYFHYLADLKRRFFIWLTAYMSCTHCSSARKKFSRFAAPLLHLSGIDVTVVEVSLSCQCYRHLHVYMYIYSPHSKNSIMYAVCIFYNVEWLRRADQNLTELHWSQDWCDYYCRGWWHSDGGTVHVKMATVL